MALEAEILSICGTLLDMLPFVKPPIHEYHSFSLSPIGCAPITKIKLSVIVSFFVVLTQVPLCILAHFKVHLVFE